MNNVLQKIKSLDEKFEGISGRKVEIVILCLYCISLAVIMFFHEPWFDEAQAWQIGKYASYSDILFYLPHYEGHPPLWHLILSIPSRLGMPYELGLKSVNFLISAAAVSLIVFKAPFKRIIRAALPFSYFVFYQYGVISRPYMLVLLLLCLMALAYRRRDEKPFAFIAPMAVICFTHAYGIVICGAIAIAWIIEMWDRKNIFSFLKSMIKDKRLYALLVLLAAAVISILMIIPRPDTYATSIEWSMPFGERLVYLLFALPAECFCTNATYGFLNVTLVNLIGSSVCGIVILIFVGFYMYKHRKLLTFVIIHLFFGVFCASVYYYCHHMGLYVWILIYCFWTAGYENNIREIKFIKITEKEKGTILSLLSILGVVSIITPIYWTICCAVNDVKYSYSFGRDLNQFIKDNNLEELNIMSAWTKADPLDDNSITNSPLYSAHQPVVAYFDEGLYSNFEKGFYAHFKSLTNEQYQQNLLNWKKNGLPDVMVGYCDLTLIFDEVDMNIYKAVEKIEFGQIWKSKRFETNVFVYVREDLLEEYNFTEIEQ